MTNPQSDVANCICRSYDGSGIDQHGNASCPVHSVEAQIDSYPIYEILSEVHQEGRIMGRDVRAEQINEVLDRGVAAIQRLLIRERQLGCSQCAEAHTAQGHEADNRSETAR